MKDIMALLLGVCAYYAYKNDPAFVVAFVAFVVFLIRLEQNK